MAGIDVLVLDEANLTSDRDRAKLYTAAAEIGTKIVEVGDPQQLRGVGVGSMFGYREGRHAEALHTWARLGEVVATETSDEAVAAMVSTWLRLREGAPDPHTLTAGLLMLAATNDQVSRINDATQAVRQARGELGASATYRLPGGRVTRFQVGDLDHRNWDKPWESNDIFDIDALALAVPYCDVVVTERHRCHVLKTARLTNRMSTVVLSRLSELVDYLDEFR